MCKIWILLDHIVYVLNVLVCLPVHGKGLELIGSNIIVGISKMKKTAINEKKIKSLRYFSFKNGLNFKRNFSKYFESWIKGWDEAWGRDPCQKLSIFRNCLLPSNCIFSHWDFHACHKLRKPAMFYYNLST